MTNWNAVRETIVSKKELQNTCYDALTASGDLLTSSGDTNDNALTPTLVAGLQSSTHNTNVTSAVEGVVATTVSHLNQVLLDSLARQLGGVNEVGGTELAGPGLLAVVDIHSNDLASLVLNSTLHDGQANTASTEDSHVGALLNLGSHDSSTVTGGDTATQQTGTVGGDLGGDGNDGDIGDDGVLGESGGTHEVQQVLAAGLEARGTVGHDTLTLGSTDLTAQVGLARLAELALTALGGAKGGRG